jgi:hypothetical protein
VRRRTGTEPEAWHRHFQQRSEPPMEAIMNTMNETMTALGLPRSVLVLIAGAAAVLAAFVAPQTEVKADETAAPAVTAQPQSQAAPQQACQKIRVIYAGYGEARRTVCGQAQN